MKLFHRGTSNPIDPGGISQAQSCSFPRTRIHLRSTAAPRGFKGNVARSQHGTPRPHSHLPFPGPSSTGLHTSSFPAVSHSTAAFQTRRGLLAFFLTFCTPTPPAAQSQRPPPFMQSGKTGSGGGNLNPHSPSCAGLPFTHHLPPGPGGCCVQQAPWQRSRVLPFKESFHCCQGACTGWEKGKTLLPVAVGRRVRMLLGCCTPAVSRGLVMEVMGALYRGCDGKISVPMASHPWGCPCTPRAQQQQ